MSLLICAFREHRLGMGGDTLQLVCSGLCDEENRQLIQVGQPGYVLLSARIRVED